LPAVTAGASVGAAAGAAGGVAGGVVGDCAIAAVASQHDATIIASVFMVSSLISPR
jgi:hypothetical protein